MTFESMITTLVVMFLYVIKPGPSVLAMVSRSLSDGFTAGITVSLGNTTAHVIYFLLAVFGYSLIETHLDFTTFMLKSVGAAYIIYIGVKGLMHLDAGLWGGKPDIQTKITFIDNYLSGLAICLSNPYAILFYVAIVPQILPLGTFDPLDIFAATILIAGSYLSMHAVISFLCGTVRQTLKNEKVVRRINMAVSLIFIGIGLFFLATMFPIAEFNLDILG